MLTAVGVLAVGVLAVAQAAVPPGYRYVGSRLVSEGRVVYWYWNPEHVEFGPGGTLFVARMYARAVDVGQERPYVSIVRCDARAYREMGAPGPFQPIEAGEPIDAVWRAGCSNGHAVALAMRLAQMGEVAPAASAIARAPVQRDATAPAAVAPPASASPAAVAPTKSEAPRADRAAARADSADPRRAKHKGIAAVACKGTMGSVFPRLGGASGKSGCF
ncbi:MAG: hypothetical protein IT521_01260 [Burkholderiales bacterium]|nr:hypothetical protein [Burkholderiales bacterium]